MHLLLFDSCSKQYFSKCTTSRSMSLQEMSTLQHTGITEIKATKICTILQLPSCQKRCNVRSIRGRPFESRLHIGYSANDHPPQVHSADDFECWFTTFLSWRKPVSPRIMRKLWSNLCDQTDDNEEQQTEDNSSLRGSESQLRAAASGVIQTQRTLNIP